MQGTFHEKLDVGDLVVWNGTAGHPPWSHNIKPGIWDNVKYGIIYDITWTYEPELAILCYMVQWDNSLIFPAWTNELSLIRKGIKGST